jgi:hypothetical protein
VDQGGGEVNIKDAEEVNDVENHTNHQQCFTRHVFDKKGIQKKKKRRKREEKTIKIIITN